MSGKDLQEVSCCFTPGCLPDCHGDTQTFYFTVGGEGGELVNQNNSLVKFQITDSKLLSGCFSPTVHQSE